LTQKVYSAIIVSMSKETTFSDPAVTRYAKDFLTSPVASERYREAAEKAVTEVVEAIKARIEEEVREKSTSRGI
jgi:hypothetical protein